MKFACEQCHTKYAIDDARVRGKVLKIRCKACQNLMIVRDPTVGESQAAPAAGMYDSLDSEDHTQISAAPAMSLLAAAGAAKGAAAARNDWFVSFDGVQEGPHSLERTRERIREEVKHGKEIFAWREGFAAWLPADKVPELAAALRPIPTPPVPPPRAPSLMSVPPALPVELKPSPSVAPTPASAPHAHHQEAPTGLDAKAVPLPARAPVIPSARPASVPATPAVEAAPKHAPPAPEAAAIASSKASAGPASGASLGADDEPEATAVATAPPIVQGALATPAAIPSSEVSAAGADLVASLLAPELPTDVVSVAKAPEPSPAAPKKSSSPAVAPLPAAVDQPIAAAVLEAPASPVEVPLAAASIAAATPIEAAIPAGEEPPHGAAVAAPLSNGVAADHGAAHAVAEPVAAPAPPPVMVVAPAPQRRGMILALVGCVLVIVLLGGALGYQMMTRTPEVVVAVVPAPTPPPAPAPEPTAKIDDRPVGIVDSPPPVAPTPAPAPPVRPVAAPVAPSPAAIAAYRRRHGGRMAPAPAAPAGGAPLSADQKRLADMYRSDTAATTPDRIPKPTHVDQPTDAVSDSQIMGVVTRNKKSVQLCFERSLKHDPTLKNLRVDVELKIGISGSVTTVSLSDPRLVNSELGTCLKQTIHRWRFPAQDSEYQTAFPLLLQAQ